MIEQLKYVNHRGDVLEFGNGKLFVNENDLRDFAWDITSKNDKISGFSKGIVKKAIPIVLKCSTEEEGIALRNQLFEIFEKDVIAVSHGKFIIGDYYLKCFITECEKSNYLLSKNFMTLKVTVATDQPYWVKETKTTFGHHEGSSGGNLDYNNDFPMDYSSNLIGIALNNPDFVPSNFKIRIYGACENPTVTIAGHDYSVNARVAANEYLDIDSIGKTIMLTKSDGTKDNYFNYRNRDSYIFEKIPSGISNVSRSSGFKFEITLLEERGEPKWT